MKLDTNPRSVRNADGWVDTPGQCCVCGWDDNNLVTDHCHATGFVRGQLCRPCNNAEGRDAGDWWPSWRLTAPRLAERVQYVGGWGSNGAAIPGFLTDDELASLPMADLLELHRTRLREWTVPRDRAAVKALEALLDDRADLAAVKGQVAA